MTAVKSKPAHNLSGTASVPGDKSISHRALMIGAMAVGKTVISGLLEGDDVMRTASALELMGVRSTRRENGCWCVYGRGVGGLIQPEDILNLGNSGTGARLLMGLVSTHDLTAHFTGDASLRNRPMARITDPMQEMGAQVIARDRGRMPLVIIGANLPIPIEYRLPVPSAQIKSAVLFAGLNTPGITRVIETRPSRNHTELMLRYFGADIDISDTMNGERVIKLRGQPELDARNLIVPGDTSSAAFAVVAALITKGSEIIVHNVGLNPLRAGIFETLSEMGAEISFENRREQAGEPAADLTVRSSTLKGVTVPAARAPSMIDEYPILAVAAAAATGTTRMYGLSELRVKESDRLKAIADGLACCGVGVEIENDDLIIHGTGGNIPGAAIVEARMDHRIAMAFLILGMGANAPISVDDISQIGTSFPGFTDLMTSLGAEFSSADDS